MLSLGSRRHVVERQYERDDRVEQKAHDERPAEQSHRERAEADFAKGQ
jgi:hypothetical protein